MPAAKFEDRQKRLRPFWGPRSIQTVMVCLQKSGGLNTAPLDLLQARSIRVTAGFVVSNVIFFQPIYQQYWHVFTPAVWTWWKDHTMFVVWNSVHLTSRWYCRHCTIGKPSRHTKSSNIWLSQKNRPELPISLGSLANYIHKPRLSEAKKCVGYPCPSRCLLLSVYCHFLLMIVAFPMEQTSMCVAVVVVVEVILRFFSHVFPPYVEGFTNHSWQVDGCTNHHCCHPPISHRPGTEQRHNDVRWTSTFGCTQTSSAQWGNKCWLRYWATTATPATTATTNNKNMGEQGISLQNITNPTFLE